jgi:hypothetical protein
MSKQNGAVRVRVIDGEKTNATSVACSTEDRTIEV